MPLLPVVRYNNFTKSSNAPLIGVVCKLMIIVQFACGLNRIPALGITNVLYLTLATLYVILLNVSIVVFAYVLFPFERDDFPGYIKLIKYIFSCIFGCFTWKRIRNYYRELGKTDLVMGFRPQDNKRSMKTVLQLACGAFITTATTLAWDCPQYLPVNLTHIIENVYYGHLITLLKRKLEMLVYFLETSLVNKTTGNFPVKLVSLQSREINDVSMNEIMEAYYIIIDAGDLLIEAMKWQLLTMISVTFVTSLLWSYDIAALYLREDIPLTKSALSSISVIITELFPLVAPCLACDGVRAEVGRLRELLSSKLHETKLDKRNRNITRALLTLTKTRNLSFSLFRMVDISVSLLFSFLGLLATYMIILLQFEKVLVQNT